MLGWESMKAFFSLCVLLLLSLIIFQQADAKRVLPQKRGGVPTRLLVSPKLHRDKQALVVSFGNLHTVNSLSYSLTYKTNGQQEGAIGSVSPSERNATRELLFGTCSKNVCRYHTRISNAKFEVVAKLKSGKTQTRRYRIRI